MTETPPTACPACGSGSVSHRPAIESWICDDCSYVLSSDEQPQVTGQSSSPTNTTTGDATSTANRVDWESQIAVTDTSEANLVDALTRTETIAEKVSLSAERTLRAGEMIAEAWQTNFMHGRSQERTVAAVIYAVSREVDTAIPPAQIADAVATDKASIKQTFQKLNRELELDIGPPLPREFVTAISTNLELPANIEPTAKHLLKQHDVAGGNPVGIAAAAVYITCEQSDVDVTLKELAAVTGLTKETIWRQKSAFVEASSSDTSL